MERLGYTLHGQTYYKKIGDYEITLFPTRTGEMLRRITLLGNVVEIKKIQPNEVESDDMFRVIISQTPKVIETIKVEPEIIVQKSGYNLQKIVSTNEVNMKGIIGPGLLKENKDIDTFQGVITKDLKK